MGSGLNGGKDEGLPLLEDPFTGAVLELQIWTWESCSQH
jgi:hypothetical protein